MVSAGMLVLMVLLAAVVLQGKEPHLVGVAVLDQVGDLVGREH